MHGLTVGLSDTIVSPAKTAEPIEMPFWVWTRVGPVNHVLDGGTDSSCYPLCELAIIGEGATLCKV